MNRQKRESHTISQFNKLLVNRQRAVFLRLKGLLGHDVPVVGETAVTALGGFVRGERAAKEILRSFQDPDESVRHAAVFMITHLRYGPALEHVTRLPRDRSKRVREMARKAVIELSAECP